MHIKNEKSRQQPQQEQQKELLSSWGDRSGMAHRAKGFITAMNMFN